MEISQILLWMLFFLFMEAFFSGSEIGVVSADRMKLRHQAAKGSRGARLALEMLQKPEWLLSTTLVGTNIAIVSNTTLATLLAVKLFGHENSWLAILGVAPLIWVFGEIVPKSVFQQRADLYTPRVIFVLRAASFVFYPVLTVFSFLTRQLARLAGGESSKTPFTLREELDVMLQMPATDHGDVLPAEKTMIRRMFNIGEMRVRDILIPSVHVVSVPRNATCVQALSLTREHGHTRLPVFSGRVDNIIGYVSGLDLLGQPNSQPIEPFVKPIPFVPGAKPLEDLLRAFREDGGHMAAVVGEFGGCQGIITLEDILERVVGDIDDEYDTQEQSPRWVKQLGPGQFVASGRIDLGALKERVGVELPDGPYETLGGFLLERFEEIPAEGRSLQWEGVRFTVEKASDRAILEVEMSMKAPRPLKPTV
ncbi:hemolysin family protein [Magnetofaba australis]|uniref:HlyC/CorC family transporter n=1 Tax=Magnetofaba australis IT-1 TaxID=1434232 RepID=A0A1Y2K4M2_9PROT|nr:hemolysin family protein [Magnetofaba australis]OSM04310.1 hypothetical protein MAIT1_04185 [Magnetofaba australis IT-1]